MLSGFVRDGANGHKWCRAGLALVWVITALLAGCGTFTNPHDVGALPSTSLADPNVGIVIVGTGAPDKCIVASSGLRVRDADKNNRWISSIEYIPVDVYTFPSDYTDHFGTLNALALPAGHYALTPWILNMAFRPVSTPTFEFEVRAGETVYIGHLFTPEKCGKIYFVQNHFQTDWQLATEKNPALSNRSPVVRLMTVGTPIKDDIKEVR